MSQVTALDKLQRLYAIQEDRDSRGIELGTVRLAELDAIAACHGVDVLNAKYANGDEATAAAILAEYADNHPGMRSG